MFVCVRVYVFACASHVRRRLHSIRIYIPSCTKNTHKFHLKIKHACVCLAYAVCINRDRVKIRTQRHSSRTYTPISRTYVLVSWCMCTRAFSGCNRTDAQTPIYFNVFICFVVFSYVYLSAVCSLCASACILY